MTLLEKLSMPQNLPIHALSRHSRLTGEQREDKDQTSLWVVLAFALTPLLFFSFLLLIIGPEQMVWVICDESQCLAL